MGPTPPKASKPSDAKSSPKTSIGRRKLGIVYNAFTKSYLFRYVVHGKRAGDDLTLCGRTVFQDSKIKFNEEDPTACKKCLQRLNIERRVHPGWDAS